MDRVINDIEAAKRLGIAVQTLRNKRSKGLGPVYMKLGTSVRYRVADLEEYLLRNRIDPEARK